MTHSLLAFPLPLLSPTDSGVELNLNHGHEKCQHLQHLKVKKKGTFLPSLNVIEYILAYIQTS